MNFPHSLLESIVLLNEIRSDRTQLGAAMRPLITLTSSVGLLFKMGELQLKAIMWGIKLRIMSKHWARSNMLEKYPMWWWSPCVRPRWYSFVAGFKAEATICKSFGI